MLFEGTAGPDRFGGLRIRVDWNVQFSAKDFETAYVVAVFVGQQHPVQLFRRHTALFKAEDDLAGAQSAVDQDFAMIGGDQGAVSGTAAAEHRQTEHDRYLATACRFSQINFAAADEFSRPAAQGCVVSCRNNRVSETSGSLRLAESR